MRVFRKITDIYLHLSILMINFDRVCYQKDFIMSYKRSFFPLATALLFCMSTSLKAALPDDYQSLSSDQKQIILWQNIEESHQNNPLPKLVKNDFWHVLKLLKGLFDLKPSFDYVSDEMPKKRVKIIHANGSVGKISFTATSGHPFTGLFKTGGIGLARLSVAKTPEDKDFVPGMAIKFLIPGQPSVNLHVMHSLEGQGANWNFFANIFSNQISHPTSFALKAIEKIFEWTKKPANELDVHQLAVWDNQGHEIENAQSPTKMLFIPSSNVANVIDPDSREDFRLSLEKIPYGPMYEVYGELNGVTYHIGTLHLDSPLLASDYGDLTLFFQHQR
jgi:hypothetical protein